MLSSACRFSHGVQVFSRYVGLGQVGNNKKFIFSCRPLAIMVLLLLHVLLLRLCTLHFELIDYRR